MNPSVCSLRRRLSQVLCVVLITTAVLITTVSCSADSTSDDVASIPTLIALASASGSLRSTDDGDDAASAAAELPCAYATFSFWQDASATSSAATGGLVHMFDATPEQTLDKYTDTYYYTQEFYPINNSRVFGYAFAVDTSMWSGVTLTRPEKSVASVDEIGQTVTFRSLTNDQWSNIYVSRDRTGRQTHLSGTLQSPFTLDDDRRFYFWHPTTRFDLYMWRSENMSGSGDEQEVTDIHLMARSSHVPTRLIWSHRSGFCAAAAATLTQDSWSELLWYRYALPSTNSANYRLYVGSIYLLLDEVALSDASLGQGLLPLRLTAKYGDEQKTFTVRIAIDPTSLVFSKQDDPYYSIGEQYDVNLVFDTDALHAVAQLVDWEAGGSTVISVSRPSEGGSGS